MYQGRDSSIIKFDHIVERGFQNNSIRPLFVLNHETNNIRRLLKNIILQYEPMFRDLAEEVKIRNLSSFGLPVGEFRGKPFRELKSYNLPVAFSQNLYIQIRGFRVQENILIAELSHFDSAKYYEKLFSASEGTTLKLINHFVIGRVTKPKKDFDSEIKKRISLALEGKKDQRIYTIQG